MTDWKKIADARNLGIPPDELDRAAAVMQQLEDVFRPLAAALPFETEPDVQFSVEADQ